VAVLVLVISGCSGQAPSPAGAPEPNAGAAKPNAGAAAIDGGAALGAAGGPCRTTPPASWQAAISRGRLWQNRVDRGITLAPSPDAAVVLHEANSDTAAHFTMMGADQRVVEELGTVPRPAGSLGGASFTAVDADHVAIAYLRDGGEHAADDWDLYLADRHRHTFTRIAGNPSDAAGKPLSGGWVHPVLTPKYLYWIQAAPDPAGYTAGHVGSALEQYSFATGRTRTLYSGLVESLVAYGNQILFTAVPAGSPQAPVPASGHRPEIVRAIDQDSGVEAAPPVGITAGADGADFMVSEGDLVVWNTSDGGVRGWRPAWRRSVDLVPPFSHWAEAARSVPAMGYPSMPRLSGPYLVWNSGLTYVMDLRTNAFTQLTTHHGAQDVSGGALAFWEYTQDSRPAAPETGIQYSQYVVDIAALPGLPACGAR
jgi:hypothetical protein